MCVSFHDINTLINAALILFTAGNLVELLARARVLSIKRESFWKHLSKKRKHDFLHVDMKLVPPSVFIVKLHVESSH
eukprot:725500-Pyramimonas_sp.AAC.1